jgi:O-acetyl-ADP-ribose deacetylase (regulator of RNase III)
LALSKRTTSLEKQNKISREKACGFFTSYLCQNENNFHNSLNIKIGTTQLSVIQGDITRLEVDVIVNAANSSLLGGGGVDGAIHRAGGKRILQECMEIRKRQGGCPPGEAVITTAGDLPAKHVIHTVGPVWMEGSASEYQTLTSCYRESLWLARQQGLRSIAFPNISTGVYGFPKQPAANLALRSVKTELLAHPEAFNHIIFACFDPENYSLYLEMLPEIME